MTNITESFSSTRLIRLSALLIALVMIGVAGWLGYRWYNQRINAAAYNDLVQHQESYNKLLASSSGIPSADKLQEVAQAFTIGAERHKSSALAPFFLVYKSAIAEEQSKRAEGADQQGKLEEALSYIDQALSKMQKSSPFYEYYALKRALLQLDQVGQIHEQSRNKGMQELTQLAESSDSGIRDMALYYKGLYEHAHNNAAQAHQTWELLLTKAKPDSHWRKLAQEGI